MLGGARAQVALARADARRGPRRPTGRTSSPAINVQVCWEKFCRYWDVEPRLVPMEGDRYHLGADGGGRALRREHDRRRGDPRVDLRRQLRAGRGDRRGARRARARRTASTSRSTSTPPPAASSRRSSSPSSSGTSGSRACSRSTPPGTSTGSSTRRRLGAVARRARRCPQDLIFDVNYLGGHMPTFALNFSRPGSEVVAQYYMFASLGREGYRAVQQRSSDIARYLAAEIAADRALRADQRRQRAAGVRVRAASPR